MSRKNSLLFLPATLFLLLSLVGVSCAPQTPAATKNSANTAPAVIKKPAPTEPQNPVNDFCEKNNNEIIIRFDAKSQKSQSYCRFSDTTECAAESYYAGKCGPGQGSKIYQSEEEQKKYVVCDQKYEPVCGENFITFTNECVANTQQAKIIHTGVCTDVEEKTTLPETNNNSAISPSKPDWLPLIVSLLQGEAKKQPPAFIEKCVFGDNTVYFQSDGCAACAGILYNEEGKVLCYPHNDTNQNCPEFFSYKNKKNNCLRLWTDSR